MTPAHVTRHLVLLTATFLTACGKDTPLFAPDPVAGKTPTGIPTPAISDAANAGNASFYFLPPMVRAPSFSGEFDSDLSPEIRICRHVAGGCDGAPIAVFTTTTGPGSERIRVDAASEHYIANWHTNQFAIIDGATYRVSVKVNAVPLGYADVQVFPTANEAKNLQSNDIVRLVDGRTLPIKFRIERGMVFSVSVTPNPMTVIVGKQQPLTATLRDPHGNVVTGSPIVWASNAPLTATVDEAGVVTGVTLGTTTVGATSNGYTAWATVSVIRPPVGTITVVPGSTSVVVTNTVQLDAIVRDGDGNILTDRAILWTTSNPNIATVDQDGLVHAVALGAATISATSEGVAGTAEVSVVRPPIARVDITTGEGHSCSLTPNGEAYCWGSNALGQLGLGAVGPTQHVPRPVSGGLLFAQISAGSHGYNTCALTLAGTAYCWGDNQFGALGDGTYTRRASPTPVQTSLAFTQIVTNGANTCGIASDATAWCWGVGTEATGASGNTPQPVTGGHLFRELATGGQHWCGIDLNDIAWCWGNNATRALGNTGAQPVQVLGNHAFLTITAGQEFTCALDLSGYAWCWGTNDFGVFANGLTNGTWGSSLNGSLSPVMSTSGLRFTTLKAASNDVCGITLGGDTYCWGWNKYGQLGDGTFMDRMTPLAVAGGVRFSALGLPGSISRCALAEDGRAYCWGSGEYGQLGNGSFLNKNVPTLVSPP